MDYSNIVRRNLAAMIDVSNITNDVKSKYRVEAYQNALTRLPTGPLYYITDVGEGCGDSIRKKISHIMKHNEDLPEVKQYFEESHETEMSLYETDDDESVGDNDTTDTESVGENDDVGEYESSVIDLVETDPNHGRTTDYIDLVDADTEVCESVPDTEPETDNESSTDTDSEGDSEYEDTESIQMLTAICYLENSLLTNSSKDSKISKQLDKLNTIRGYFLNILKEV